MAILTMPVIVLFVLRIVAMIADGRTSERSKRVIDAIDRAERSESGMQPDVSATSVSVLTEEGERDQG